MNRSFQRLDLRDPRLVELDAASVNARKAREELHKRLAQTVGVTCAVENDLKSQYSGLRANARQSKFISVAAPITSWWSLPAYLFWTIVVVQFILVVIMYR